MAAAALFEFLSAAARTGVIAAGRGLGMDGLHRLGQRRIVLAGKLLLVRLVTLSRFLKSLAVLIVPECHGCTFRCGRQVP